MKRMLMLASVALMIDQFNMPNIRLLQEMGYEVDVACNFEKGNTCSDEKIEKLKSTLNEIHVRFYQVDFARDITQVFQNIKAFRQVNQILRKNQYTFIHCHSPIGGVAGRVLGKLNKTKVIYTAHGFHFYKGAPLKNWLIYYPVEWICSWMTDTLITINAEDYIQAKNKFHAKRVRYIPGVGVEVGKFMQPNISMSGKAFYNIMPCLIHNVNGVVGGVKVVTRYSERIPSLDSKILLFNADSGEFLALMDGNWITAMRTGAVAAHSVIHFAKTDWNTVGIIGLGNVARASMLILASKTLDKLLTVKLLRYKNQAELFVERFKDFRNLDFQIVDTIQECIEGSDVVVSCATYFENDIAENGWFKKGVLVIPVHTRGFMNCDLFFDKVFADDTGHVDHFTNFTKF